MKTTQRPKLITIVRAIVHTTGLYSKGVDYVVESRDPNKIKLEDLQDGTFAIQFYSYIYSEVTRDGVVHPMKSEEFDPSPIIYIAGKMLDRTQLAEDYPDIAANVIKQMNEYNLNNVVMYGGKFKFMSNDSLFWDREDHRKYYYDRYK